MKMFKVDDVMKAFRECKDPKDFMFKIYSEVKLIDAIPVSDDTTNGDVIKAMFPKLESREKAFEIELNVNKNKIGNISANWWNAPYRNNKGV